MNCNKPAKQVLTQLSTNVHNRSQNFPTAQRAHSCSQMLYNQFCADDRDKVCIVVLISCLEFCDALFYVALAYFMCWVYLWSCRCCELLACNMWTLSYYVICHVEQEDRGNNIITHIIIHLQFSYQFLLKQQIVTMLM